MHEISIFSKTCYLKKIRDPTKFKQKHKNMVEINRFRKEFPNIVVKSTLNPQKDFFQFFS